MDPGNAVFERATVGPCGAPLGGYTLVTANDFAEAVEIARGCPVLQAEGGVEVGLLTHVPGLERPVRIF